MGWFKKSRKPPEDGWWQEVHNLTAKLRQLGLDDGGEAYRNRLSRLCAFIRELEPHGANTLPKPSDFDRYERAFALTACSPREIESYIQRLEDLRVALKPLVKTDREDATKYIDRLQSWSPTKSLKTLAGERSQDHSARLQRVERALKVLGLDLASPEEMPQRFLKDLDGLLKKPERCADPLQLVEEGQRWRELVEDCAGDWEWAYLQILVRLAGECRKERPVSAKFRQQVTRAEKSLAKAIPRMERQGLLQYRTQGLYGVLAATHLAHAKSPHTGPVKRLKLIERAFTYSRHAIELEPESIHERLVLLDVLSTLEDAGELNIQAEIALNFDSGPGTLRTIGASYWGRSAILSSRGARLRLLRDAARFFTTALQEVESAPFDGDAPLDQVQAHGWAHFWLGRFQCELGKYAEAIAHLRTASVLGFKPLESRVELAWACYLSRDRKHANNAFREALDEVHRQRTPDTHDAPIPLVSWAPGEERKINELKFDACLGWAFLCADWDPDRALQNIAEAEKLLRSFHRPNPEELEAALSEARGRVHLRKGNFSAGIRELEDAIKKSARAGAYCALGFARLEQVETAKTNSTLAKQALRDAREAYLLARESDRRRRYRREIWELRCRLRRFELAVSGGAAAPAQLAPGAIQHSPKPDSRTTGS